MTRASVRRESSFHVTCSITSQRNGRLGELKRLEAQEKKEKERRKR